MRFFRPALLLALCTFFATMPLASQEPQTSQATTSALTNKDIITMVNAGLSQEIISAKIKSSNCDFDTSPDALKELKIGNVPDTVILAMVQAPAASKVPTTAEGVVRTANVQCGIGGSKINLLSSPGNFSAVATLRCDEHISILDDKESYYKVRTDDGKVGYISHYYVKEEIGYLNQSSSAPTIPSPTARNTLAHNTLRAVAWRAVPWITTTYYQQPGNASTNCTGSGTWLGNVYQGNTSCSTQYTPAQNVPINWTHFTVYNLVETADSRVVLSCTRNWAFSKCSYLIPGNDFGFEYKKGKISITGHRGGKDKEQALDFDIVSSEPK